MISGDQECKTSKSASMTVSVTLQAVSGKWRCLHKPRLHITFTVMLTHSLVLHSSPSPTPQFSRKRETARSLNDEMMTQGRELKSLNSSVASSS